MKMSYGHVHGHYGVHVHDRCKKRRVQTSRCNHVNQRRPQVLQEKSVNFQAKRYFHVNTLSFDLGSLNLSRVIGTLDKSTFQYTIQFNTKRFLSG